MAKNPFPGTSFEKTRGKWKAQYRKNGVVKSLGYHDSQEEAYQAVLAAKREDAAVSEIQLTSDRSYLSAYRNHRTEIVAQSNVLIERPWSMSMLEARIFVLMLRGLQAGAAPDQLISVPLTDLFGPGPVGGSAYQFLHAALDTLGSIRIDLPKSDKIRDYHKAPLLGLLQLDHGRGSISGYFSTAVIPYLTNLLAGFTLGQVSDLMSIKSINTYRMYWLFMMWKFRSPHCVTVEELRELTTGPDAYKQYADYRLHVLKPSLAELNSLNFNITYKELKKGRSVDSIIFDIQYKADSKPKPQQLQLLLDSPATASLSELTDFQSRVAGRMRKFKLTESQIAHILTLSEDELKHLMKETHQLLKEYEAGTKVFDNIAATAMSRINALFPRVYPKIK